MCAAKKTFRTLLKFFVCSLFAGGGKHYWQKRRDRQTVPRRGECTKIFGIFLVTNWHATSIIYAGSIEWGEGKPMDKAAPSNIVWHSCLRLGSSLSKKFYNQFLHNQAVNNSSLPEEQKSL